MKNIWTKHKWLWLIFINILPFVLNVVFYENGATDDLILFLPIFAGLTVLNFRNTTKTLHFIFIQLLILVCIVCSGHINTSLYYHNISDDYMTPVVGKFFVYLESATDIITTVVLAVRRSKQTDT